MNKPKAGLQRQENQCQVGVSLADAACHCRTQNNCATCVKWRGVFRRVSGALLVAKQERQP